MAEDDDANPDTLQIWDGRVYSRLGTGPRQIKAQFAPVEAYTVTLFMEESTCSPQLCDREAAINFLRDPERPRAIQYQLLRDISPTSIPPHCIEDMMLKTLGPVMGSDLGPALDFKSYILRQNLRTGSRVTVLFSTDGSITAVTTAPGASFNAVECHPELITQSPALCAGVFEVYLREKSVAPLARDAWIRSVMAPDRGQT
ncbi:hypothetical protein ACKKBG_A03490 [Auxenochlorella protothecoides x Auxenochlorella symbiontica]